MPRILVAGAPTGCWTNLGDEAILAGMLAALADAAPGSEVTVVSSCPDGFLEARGCATVRFEDLDGLVDAVAASDVVVLGGGSIFFDYWGADPTAVLTPRHQGLSLWAGLALLAAAHDVPVATWGVGVGPLRTPAGRLLTRATLAGATVTLRDPDALEALRDLGHDEPAVVTGDPALRTPPPVAAVDGPDGTEGPDGSRPGDGPVLVVAVRPWDVDVDPHAWPATVAAALDRHLERAGGTVRFVPCHRSVAWPLSDDRAASEAVRAAMDHADRTELVDVERPWAERAALIADADALLTMRYHGALFALRAGVPTVGLCYDPKVTGLLRDWGPAATALPVDVDADRLDEALREAFADADARRSSALARALELAERERATVATVVAATDGPGGGADPATGTERSGVTPATTALLRALGDDAERPAPVVAALDRLRRRAGLPVSRPTVALLTNRVLDRSTGQPAIGGAERYGLELARLLRDLGCEPTFYQQGGDWGTGDFFGFPVIALPEGEAYSEFAVGAAAAFAEATADADHVVVLAPNYAAGALRDDAIVVSHGVWWDHDLWTHLSFRTPEWHENLERVFTRAACVVSVDEAGIAAVRAMLPAAAERLRFIPNAVDTERFHPPAGRFDPAPDDAADGPPRVVFPRRADVIRGPQLVGPVLEQVPDPLEAVWVGDGDPAMVAELQRVAAEDGRLSVTTAAFDEMPDVLRRADVVVIPTVASEGQSLACLEAMASGCAVIVTRVGGLPELIDHDVDGLVCDPTPASLAAALRRVVRDPALRRRLGASARRSAERHSLVRWRAAWAELLVEQGWVRSATPAVPYDVVCFSIIDWEFRWQRPQQMARAWAQRGRRVFYLRITDHLDAEVAPGAVDVHPLEPNVWEVRLALPGPWDVYSGDLPDGLAQAAQASLRTLVAEEHIEHAVGLVELATWHPAAVAARDAFGWPLLYDCMDDWATFPGFDERPAFLELERRLVADADALSVSSRTIQRRWEGARPDLVLARNAADFAFFHDAAGPDPLPDVTGPVAGFFGAVVEWFAVDLLAEVARARPHVTFVLVGNVARVDVSALEALPNVRFEGLQPYDAMPRYLARFDVALIPFLVNAATDGMDVVKVYEYLSQGTPVVSTPIREIVAYGDVVALADDAASFGAALDAALADDDPTRRARRLALARHNTWDDRLDLLESELLAHLGGAASAGRWTAERTSVPPAEVGAVAHAELDGLRRAQAAWETERTALRNEVDAYRRSRVVQVAGTWWRAKAAVAALIRRARRTR